MLKRILLPLEPSAHGCNARLVALRIASLQKAQVTALSLLDRPGIRREVGTAPVGGGAFAADMVKGREKEAMDGMARLIAEFTQQAAEAGVEFAVKDKTGEPAELIVEQSMFHDLVVMGLKSDFNFDGEADDTRRYVQAVLDKSATAVLGIPSVPMQKVPQNVLITFNGSIPSARALHWATEIPWFKGADVRLLMADTTEQEALPLLAKAEEFLLSHEVGNVTPVWSEKKVLTALKGEHMEWADLIVAGAHSKRLLDIVLGSLAEFLIQQDQKPVLICG